MMLVYTHACTLSTPQTHEFGGNFRIPDNKKEAGPSDESPACSVNDLAATQDTETVMR